MRSLRLQGRWSVLAAGAAAGLIASTGAFWIVRHATQPAEWRVLLDREVPLLEPAAPGVVLTHDHALRVRIMNDLLRRSQWGRDEAVELCGLMREAGPARSPIVSRTAMLALLARLETRAPVSDDARRMIIDALSLELAEPDPSRRSDAAMALIVTRSIEESTVRHEVESLLEDPDPDTAQIVANQLAHYDDQRARALAFSRPE